jgi:signal transduction histidine kinase
VRRAAVRVLNEPLSVGEGTQTEDLREQLEVLCRAVTQSMTGEKPLLDRATAAVASTQSVLHRLRARTIDEVEDAGDAVTARDLLLLLRGFEGVQLALDRDEAHRFASQLSGAGAMELLVEVAHDLRSPLASILFLADTLRNARSGPVTEVQERQLGIIYSAAFGLSTVASDVIELARGGDRLVSGTPVPFSMADLLHSVRDIVQPIAEERGLTVRLVLPDADYRIGHPGALSRVLLNLATNALKFTSEGFVEVAAHQRSRTRVEFSVQDTGRGIPPEVVSCLFDTFRRRRNTATYAFSSAGLGLSISRKLVRAMGGELEVDTSPTSGTRFHFEVELPAASRV